MLDQHVRPGTLITDAGSTKAAIVERATETIRRGRFVGGIRWPAKKRAVWKRPTPIFSKDVPGC